MGDLKMHAAAMADNIVTGNRDLDLREIVLLCLLGQYLAWAKNSGGKLFQGTGGFTRDFLVPSRFNHLGCLEGALCRETTLGHFMPTPAYMDFAKSYFKGACEGSSPSWGNGSVMCFTPVVVLARRWAEKFDADAASCALSLASTHADSTALLAGMLLGELLEQVHAGRVNNSSEIPKA